jgi:hypothetical protein
MFKIALAVLIRVRLASSIEGSPLGLIFEQAHGFDVLLHSVC